MNEAWRCNMTLYLLLFLRYYNYTLASLKRLMKVWIEVHGGDFKFDDTLA